MQLTKRIIKIVLMVIVKCFNSNKIMKSFKFFFEIYQNFIQKCYVACLQMTRDGIRDWQLEEFGSKLTYHVHIVLIVFSTKVYGFMT